MVHTGTVSLHPVLLPWGEGASLAPMGEGGGGDATDGDATWIHTFFDLARWATPGGDFNPVASVSVAVEANGLQTFGTTPEMVLDVQGWLDDPASNNGWLVRQDDEAAQAIRFDSRQNTNAADRPSLTINFALPPLLISPQSGILAATQVLDIVMITNFPAGITIATTSLFLDGVDVTDTLAPCFSVMGTVTEGGQTFRCPQQTAGEVLGVGSHELRVVLTLSDGMMEEKTVNWVVVGNTEP